MRFIKKKILSMVIRSTVPTASRHKFIPFGTAFPAKLNIVIERIKEEIHNFLHIVFPIFFFFFLRGKCSWNCRQREKV